MAAFTGRLLAEADIHRGMHVLAVGCGTGEVSVRLAPVVGLPGRITGLIATRLAWIERVSGCK